LVPSHRTVLPPVPIAQVVTAHDSVEDHDIDVERIGEALAPCQFVRVRHTLSRSRWLAIWREWARGQLARECIVITSIIVVALMAVRIIKQPVQSVNGFIVVTAPSASVPSPVLVSSQPVAQLAPERPAPARVSRRSLLERATTRSQKPLSVSPQRLSAPVARVADRKAPVASAPATRAIESPVVTASPQVVGVVLAPQLAHADAVPARATIVPANDRSSIERLLEAYRVAYDKLDASSAAAVWPGVDTRALNRAFQALAEQDVSFDSCNLDIGGANANARCVGEIRYVGRVGDQSPQVRRLSWSFELERVSDRWQIAQVAAR
jgi:hypothetical protein